MHPVTAAELQRRRCRRIPANARRAGQRCSSPARRDVGACDATYNGSLFMNSLQIDEAEGERTLVCETTRAAARSRKDSARDQACHPPASESLCYHNLYACGPRFVSRLGTRQKQGCTEQWLAGGRLSKERHAHGRRVAGTRSVLGQLRQLTWHMTVRRGYMHMHRPVPSELPRSHPCTESSGNRLLAELYGSGLLPGRWRGAAAAAEALDHFGHHGQQAGFGLISRPHCRAFGMRRA